MGSSKPGFNMNGLVVLAACVCASSAQVLVGGYAGAIDPAPSSQFHAQDEFGQFSFGHAGGPSARTEARNAYGVTTGSYQYLDSNGVIQTANYISDPVHGFRVAATNLPVGPAVPEVVPLVAPVFDLPLPVAPEDTAEVAAAKAAHLALLAEATAAERKRRDADEEAVAAPLLPFPYAYGGLGLGLHHGLFAGAPGAIVANIEPATAVVAEAPTLKAGLPLGLPLGYAGHHGVLAAPAPASREAVLTTIKANPGHAIVYTVA